MTRIIMLIAAALMLASCSSADWPGGTIAVAREPDTTAIAPASHYVVVVGDIQAYTMNAEYMPYFKASMDWLAIQQSFFGNIDAVLQVGDLTNDNDETQWNRALLAMRGVAQTVPTVAVPGNHDYHWAKEEGERFKLIYSRLSSGFDSHALPLAPGLAVVDTYEFGSRHNALYRLRIGGRDARILALEFGPRRGAVEWAARLIAAEPDADFYILTHEWLTPAGEISSRGGWCDGVAQFAGDTTVMAPDEVFDALVRPNDNVVAVVCGHHQFVKYLETPNDAGRPVPQVLFNLQYQERGGDGMLQLWEFTPAGDTVNVSVYRTIDRLFNPAAETALTFTRRE